MSKIFVVVGLVFLAGGAYAIGDGWPYLVLERGFTQVILGAISATLGILLLAIAVVFGAIQRLETTLEEHIAGAHSGAGFAPSVEPGTQAVPVTGESRPAFAPHLEAHAAPSILPGVAAAAGAVAIGAGMAGLVAAKPEDEARAHDGLDEADQADLFQPAPVAAVTRERADEIEERVEALDRSDWVDSLETDPFADPEPVDDAVAVDAESSDEEMAEAAFVEDADEKPAPVQETLDEEISREDTLPEAIAPDAAEPDVEPLVPSPVVPVVSVTPEPMDEAAPSSREEPWWPRIQPRDQQPEPPSAETRDEFGDLRAELSHALRAPLPSAVPEEPSVAEEVAEEWSTPRPWPPVTQPVAPEALDEPEPRNEVVAEEPGKDDVVDEWGALTEAPEEPAPAAAEAVEPKVEKDDAPSAAEPVASQDGVVGAYQVGEAHFTMYADGSIQASTPEGDYVFASMDELKAYLAREKSKLEPGAA